MRFVFGAAGEREMREQVLARADRALELIADHLRRCEPLGPRAQEGLAGVAKALAAEVLTERDGSKTVVVSPRGEQRLRPLAEAIVARAPSLPRARFTSHRPARSTDEALGAVSREQGFDLSCARARAGFSRGHLLDVVVYAPGFPSASDHAARAAARCALRGLLGERLLDDWIGAIDVAPASRGGLLPVVDAPSAPTFPLGELPAAVSRAVESVRAGLPEVPREGIARDGWVLFETEPEAQMDHAAQDDVALASSALPEMLKCFLEGAPFSSARFTRGSERFAYLKVDCPGLPFESRIAARTRLEDALAPVLAARSAGAVVGNGLGLRYLYVDLALALGDDLALALGDETIEAVCRVAREAGAAKRSWLLFCDGDLADEWVGVWPDSPLPPGM